MLITPPTLSIALSLALLACGTPQQPANSLDPEVFAERIGKNEAQLVDVRTPAEYAGDHIAGALNLDWTSGQLEQHTNELDKSKPVLLYCASGRRSAAAREYLLDQGFTDVVDLAGGMGAWTRSGKPVER